MLKVGVCTPDGLRGYIAENLFSHRVFDFFAVPVKNDRHIRIIIGHAVFGKLESHLVAAEPDTAVCIRICVEVCNRAVFIACLC